MIALARNGYTEKEVKQALHGAKGTRSVSFRYELLDKNNIFKMELYNVTAASIDYGVFNDIRRTAQFTIQEFASVPVNYFSDRIRPYMVLDMPQNREEIKSLRYIRDWNNGSQSNQGQHWIEIEAYDSQGVNRALGRTVKGSKPADPTKPYSRVTDGDKTLSAYCQPVAGDNGLCNVVVDLGELVEIDKIKVWHYYGPDRIYKQTKTEVSADGVNWNTVFDSEVDGEYVETAAGKEITIKRPKQIEFPLGIFILSSPERVDESEGIVRNIEAYDLSLILAEDKVTDMYTVTAGTNYKTAIVDILQSAGITNYAIADIDKTVSRDLQFEVGTSKNSIINSLTTIINFTPIIVDVNGTFTSSPYVLPQDRSVDYEYNDSELSIIMRGVTEELDTFNIPNRWIIVRTNSEEEPLRSVYTNDNPASPTSTVNRGRVIAEYREIEDIADQAALDAYTRRIAENASQVYGKSKFTSALMPMHDYHDVLQLRYSKLGIDDKFTETAWTMQLEAGGTMSHEIRKVVQV